MGKKVHILSNIDPISRTADCANCGNIRIYWKTRVWRCKIGAKRTSSKRDYSYLAFKKDSCEQCGFIPIIKEQLDVDHIDGDTMNNTRDNLRIVTQQQNSWNRAVAINNTSGVKGVSKVKRNNKWIARIGYNGKRIVIGTFDNYDDAVEARLTVEKELYGEYSREQIRQSKI